MKERIKPYEDFLEMLRDEVRAYPNRSHIARQIGVGVVTLHNFMNDLSVCVNTELVEKLMKFFRFEMTLTIRRLPE